MYTRGGVIGLAATPSYRLRHHNEMVPCRSLPPGPCCSDAAFQSVSNTLCGYLLSRSVPPFVFRACACSSQQAAARRRPKFSSQRLTSSNHLLSSTYNTGSIRLSQSCVSPVYLSPSRHSWPSPPQSLKTTRTPSASLPTTPIPCASPPAVPSPKSLSFGLTLPGSTRGEA